MFEVPIIDKRIASLAPGFRAISIHVDATRAQKGTVDPSILAQACDFVSAGGASWADAHLASWAETYHRFGAKPNRTPCSAQALRKRVEKDGKIPAINPVVDLYNAVSLRYALPVGGENYDAYVGQPQLTIAEGTELFDTVMNGEAVTENPTPGEVVWRDHQGVTCRRWNWRQGSRTRLTDTARRMWFILESLETMPEDALEEAGDMLTKGLTNLMPGSEIIRQKISITSPPSK
ncbi:B3/B4 domain-containing protein [Microvirga calopogonii]|uniref:B3/B4 domain-containing protein n=1 Tax=Microvirga calopogonii TaxID=2078013 RepID=UPI000E0DC493|nr:B3/4 domain-containing protein [Microvirga calopogonii]